MNRFCQVRVKFLEAELAKKVKQKQKALRFHFAGDVPDAPSGFEFVSASVSTGGDGLFLFIEDPFGDEAHGTFTRYGAQFPEPRLPEKRIYRLVVVDGWERSTKSNFLRSTWPTLSSICLTPVACLWPAHGRPGTRRANFI